MSLSSEPVADITPCLEETQRLLNRLQSLTMSATSHGRSWSSGKRHSPNSVQSPVLMSSLHRSMSLQSPGSSSLHRSMSLQSPGSSSLHRSMSFQSTGSSVSSASRTASSKYRLSKEAVRLLSLRKDCTTVHPSTPPPVFDSELNNLEFPSDSPSEFGPSEEINDHLQEDLSVTDTPQRRSPSPAVQPNVSSPPMPGVDSQPVPMAESTPTETTKSSNQQSSPTANTSSPVNRSPSPMHRVESRIELRADSPVTTSPTSQSSPEKPTSTASQSPPEQQTSTESQSPPKQPTNTTSLHQSKQQTRSESQPPHNQQTGLESQSTSNQPDIPNSPSPPKQAAETVLNPNPKRKRSPRPAPLQLHPNPVSRMESPAHPNPVSRMESPAQPNPVSRMESPAQPVVLDLVSVWLSWHEKRVKHHGRVTAISFQSRWLEIGKMLVFCGVHF